MQLSEFFYFMFDRDFVLENFLPWLKFYMSDFQLFEK